MVLFPEECLFLFRECFSLENQGDDFAGKSALLKKTSLLFQEWPFPENFRPYSTGTHLPGKSCRFFQKKSDCFSKDSRLLSVRAKDPGKIRGLRT